MSRNDGLNLDRLDSDAADLDLVVESPEDLEHAVIPVPTAVAGAVDAIARIVSLRIHPKPRVAPGRRIQVSEGPVRSADVDLARLAETTRSTSESRTSTWHCGRGDPIAWTPGSGSAGSVEALGERRLGRSVEIDDVATRGDVCPPAAGQAIGQRLACEEGVTQVSTGVSSPSATQLAAREGTVCINVMRAALSHSIMRSGRTSLLSGITRVAPLASGMNTSRSTTSNDRPVS